MIVTAAGLALLGIGTWAASPALIPHLAGAMAAKWALDDVSIDLDRPRLDGVHVNAIGFVSAGWRVDAEDVDIRFSLTELIGGSLEQVSIARLAARQVGDDTAQEVSGGSADSGRFDTALLPPIEVGDLDLRVDTIGFHARGSLKHSASETSVILHGLAPTETERFVLEGRLQPSGELSLAFFDRNERELPFVEVQSTLTTAEREPMEIRGTVRLADYPLKLVTEILELPAGEGRIEASFVSSLPDPIGQIDFTELTAQGSITLDWTSTELGFDLSKLAASFKANAEEIRLEIASGVAQLTEPQTTWDLAELTLTSSRTDDGGARIVAAAPRGTPFQLQWDDETSAEGTFARTVVFVEDQMTVETSATFDARSAVATVAATMAVEAELDPEGKLAGTAALTLGEQKAPIEFTYDLENGVGHLTSVATHDVKAPLIASILSEWSYPYDVTDGEVTTALQLALGESVGGEIEVGLQSATAEIDGDYVRGIDSQLGFVVEDGAIWLEPSRMAADLADFGLEMQDLRAFVAWRGDELKVTQLAASALGGSLTAEEIGVNLDTLNADFDVRLNELDLGEVLALEGDDVKGSGKLTGTLPIRMRNGVISVVDGQVEALPPGGHIALAPELADAIKQPGVDFAMKALTNYTFTTLRVNAAFEENGDLRLAVALQGRNPDVERGRPIHYNLNVNENLYALLDSLRAQRSVTDRVERKVLSKQRKE